MPLLSEMVQQILIHKFIDSMAEDEALSIDGSQDKLEMLQINFKTVNNAEDSIIRSWNDCLKVLSTLSDPLAGFIEKGNKISQKFKFWTTFFAYHCCFERSEIIIL